MYNTPRSITLFLGFLFILLLCYPLYGDLIFGSKSSFYMQKLTTIIIFAILAMSLDLLVGVSGLVSMGHALFFGFAGYVLALISPEYDAANIWIVLPAVLASCAVIGLVVAFLTIKTSGIYFIMVTLAFGQMAFYFFNDSDFAGGSDGMYIMMKPAVMLGDIQLLNLESKQTIFYTSLACMALVYLILRMLLRSPFGQVLVGIHANEHRVKAIGYNTNHYKIVSFVIAATLAGLAGFLAATQYGFVNPSQLGWHTSGYALMMVIMGGAGTIFGPALGAFVFEILHSFFESFTDHWLMLMGTVMIAVVLFLPNGIGGALLEFVRKLEKKPVQAQDGEKSDG
ncbi:MAG: branched-chain amino acid ABC transporter permease [Methylocystaceae bacterium]|nr:branched-chain amino acid ABC transporter permease [Methylocystaceae bacterium]